MIFSYYGSKSKIWKKYPAPKHSIIIEPFAGAANYSLGYGSEKNVLLIEKNPVLVKMWNWLIQVSENEIRKLPIPESQQPIPNVYPEEAKIFLGFVLNQGSHSPKNYVGNFKVRNWNSICKALPKIRTWKILEGDYTISPDIEATWYIDPPYQGQKLYPYGKDLDYQKLGNWCRTRKGQVIVAENDTATWLPFRPLCVQPGQSKTSKLRNEGIWTNEVLRVL